MVVVGSCVRGRRASVAKPVQRDRTIIIYTRRGHRGRRTRAGYVVYKKHRWNTPLGPEGPATLKLGPKVTPATPPARRAHNYIKSFAVRLSERTPQKQYRRRIYDDAAYLLTQRRPSLPPRRKSFLSAELRFPREPKSIYCSAAVLMSCAATV